MSRAATMAGTLNLASFARPPSATFLWGESRPVILRVLYAMVRANDPEFYWLDIRGPMDSSEEPGPVELGWVPDSSLFLTGETSEARPQNAPANVAMWTIVRSDEPETVLARVSDFVRLPPIAQDILSRLGLDGRTRAVAIANSDRVRQYYPTTPEGVRPVLDAFLSAQVVPFFGAQGSPGEGRWAFDYVFEVRARDVAHWAEALLVPEKAPPRAGVPVGRPIPFTSLPDLAAIFRDPPRGARPRPRTGP